MFAFFKIIILEIFFIILLQFRAVMVPQELLVNQVCQDLR